MKKKKTYKQSSRRKQESTYQNSDRKLQQTQNEEIKENTQLTRYALWVAIWLGLADILIEFLQLLK